MILHIVQERDWQSAVAGGVYHADSLTSEGFIHCSTREQLLGTANKKFSGQQGLIIICIDPYKVSAPIVYEDSYNTGQDFPHIYGPLNIEAVRAVFSFPPQADGSFKIPEGAEWLCSEAQ
jgi:uncharacterized protein (DUF952 family)